jgi:hypothetical protein
MQNIIKFDPEDTKVEIIDGVLKHGILDKALLSVGASNGIFNAIYLKDGNEKAFEMIYALQQAFIRTLRYQSVTTSAVDLMMSKSAQDQIKLVISAVETKANNFINNILLGKVIAPLGMSFSDYVEQQMKNFLTFDSSYILSIIISHLDIRYHGMLRMIMSV